MRCATATVGLAVMLLGCTRVSDHQRFAPQGAQIGIQDTIPLAGAQGVHPDVQIDLCWSDLVDPQSIGDVDAVISSGKTIVDAEVNLQLFAWRGPSGADLPAQGEAPWCSGSVLSVTPTAELVNAVKYRLRLEDNARGWAGESPAFEDDGWVVADDGSALFFLEFTIAEPTAPAAPPTEPEPRTITLTDLFGPGQVFDPERATCSCHRDPENTASQLLDLRTVEAAYEALALSGRIRDTGFPMITPRRPSESFLVHKLLRDGDDEALYGVLGDAMPPGDALPYRDMVAIARWIEDGAEP